MTIYEVLKQSGVKFSLKDCQRIGVNVISSIKSRKLPIPNKVKQKETYDGQETIFEVYQYDKKQLPLIEKTAFRYFKKHLTVAK